MANQKKPYPCREFGEHLRYFRESAGMSQEYFAEKADLDRTYVSSVERGARNVSLVNICKFADALGVHPSELFDFYPKK